ncbi:hypothetical protein GCL60_06510 [Silvanigrella paludirubra]|uniref:histidine kinase n=1 Tax=Silvanigrella paludirubra TaxID=2499159 RepID=A0A6N6VVX4_9BACT|nr:histidine kinase dimerization/phosphoacceptor domain -containing protein [Silvanigrella paludirubra]KAB8039909.1 hypothetical protein GCL60_06510 [Silvanigrella paludirubra]
MIDKVSSKKYDYCENLKVNITNNIQNCAFFIAIDIDNLIIHSVSSNLHELFLENYNQFIGKEILKYLNEKSKITLKNIISNIKKNIFKRRILVELYFLINNIINKRYCVIFISQNLLCIEGFIKEETEDIYEDLLMIENEIQETIHSKKNKEELSESVCKFIREFTDSDRVYYCEFENDNHGFVIGEDTKDIKNSILHHHFPASDLPMTVRNLYIENRFRIIQDAQYTPMPIIGSIKNYDLKYSLFREIGATHIKYLSNMGIKFSSSYSVVEENVLRGLVGIHSFSSKNISLVVLFKIKKLIEAFSSKLLTQKFSKIKLKNQDINFKIIDFLKSYENENCDIGKISKNDISNIKIYFNSKFVVYGNNENLISDLEIPIEFLNKLKIIISNKLLNEEIFYTDKMIDLDADFEKWANISSGMLYISLDKSQNTFFCFFREEKIQTYKWSGDPNILEVKTDGTLNPRNSFQTWLQEIKFKSNEWTSEDLILANELRNKLLTIRSNYILKLTNDNLSLSKKNKEIEVLLSEVHHRVKNNLAILNAMFDWKIKESDNNKVIDVLKEMKSRVRAISSLHELLYQTNIYGEVNISKYISSIIRNTSSLLINNKIEFKTNFSQKINLSIQKALPVGLIVHEFITNSIKYAFENRDNGIIEIEWKNNLNDSLLALKDNGIGCSNIENLKGSSIGLEMIRLLIKQLDGRSIWNGEGGVSLQIYLKKADL